MKTYYKCFTPVIAVIISVIIINCDNKSNLDGSWGSVKIENSSSLFKNTLPSTNRGEVLLTFTPGGEFRWINKKENLDLSGTYTAGKDKILLYVSEQKPVSASYTLRDKELLIFTEDGFTFTFVKNPRIIIQENLI